MNSINRIVKSFETAKITRREFLVRSALIILTITGVSGLMKSLSNLDLTERPKAKRGFGVGPYGI